MRADSRPGNLYGTCTRETPRPYGAGIHAELGLLDEETYRLLAPATFTVWRRSTAWNDQDFPTPLLSLYRLDSTT